MLKSMTAYGRASIVSDLGRFSVELQSVNRKHLEIHTFLPAELLRYDSDVKKWIAAVVARGQVNVKLLVKFDQKSPLTVTPNVALIGQIRTAWEDIAEDLNLALDPITLVNILSRQEGVLLYDQDIQDEALYRDVLQQVISEALEKFIQMKTIEGQALFNDIMGRVDKLAEWIQEIAAKAPGATARYRQRLLEALNEVMQSESSANDERLLREVCVYADRIDIAEELTRFDSHLKQVYQLLRSQNVQGVGKTMEFLVQELNREINTISSKSSDVDVAKLVINIKTELERIREQIQNVE